MIQEIKKFIRFHIVNSNFRVKIKNPKEISDPIKNSVDNLTRTLNGKKNEIVNPQEVSDPIVEAQNRTTEAVKAIPTVNIPEADFSSLEDKIDALSSVLERKEMTVNQGDVNVDMKPVIKAIKNIKLDIPRMEEREATDYTLMLDEMMKILEKPQTETIKLQKLVKRLGTTEDLSILAEWLKKIAEKEYPETPDLKFDKQGRLKVEVDKVGGGGGGLTSLETGYLESISGFTGNLDPLAKYKFADLDDDASPNYYGATDVDGAWYILKEDTAAKTLRYATGETDYTTGWTGRVGLSYQYLYEVTLY